jgi:hypothetical protein
MLRIKRKDNSESIPPQNLQSQIENQIRTGRPLAPGLAFFDWLLQVHQKPFKPKKRFAKNPLFLSPLGQNKTLKLC